jgi:hypothetical protein
MGTRLLVRSFDVVTCEFSEQSAITFRMHGHIVRTVLACPESESTARGA